MTMRAERYRDEMFGLIEEVLCEIGPRESCSENEKRLGRKLIERWRALGIEARSEAFRCNPKAFLGFIPLSSLLYLAATITYWFAPLLCFVLAGTGMALLFFELLRYRELIDPLFPEAEGENVVAVIPAAGERKRRVVISAHQDSAYEFNLWYFLKNASIPIMVVGFAAPLFPMFGGLAMALTGADADSGFFWGLGILCLALYPIVGLNLFFHTYSVVPGAMDDLAGVSVLHGVARALTDARNEGTALLDSTEVVLLAASAEEAGLRGAKRYAAAHAAEMQELPTYGIFVDGVYDERHLTVVYRELFTGAVHDPRLVRLAKKVAGDRGWPIREHMIPLGASDATAFSTSGVPSVALLCQDATRLVENYHTRLDTIDHVRPQSLTTMLQVVLDMLEHIDRNDGPRC